MKAGASLIAILILGACQPQARRALVLDLTISDPVLLDGTARPWRDAGYAVEYRRFYPHVTVQDLARYHTLLLLLGREPETPSDALTAGDLAMLTEWLERGGVVVLGYWGEGDGTLDRSTANRWLAALGAGIAIGDGALEDSSARAGPATPPWAQSRRLGEDPLGSVYDPFPLDRSHALDVRRSAQVLAVAGRRAVVRTPKGAVTRPGAPLAAATRVGDGLVVVISRHALAALGPAGWPSTMPLLQLDALTATHDFLTALARWTRRPAEWAHVPPADAPTRGPHGGAPPPVALEPARAAPPAGATTDPLPALADTGRPPGVPDWIRHAGMRALWTPLLLRRAGGDVPRSAAALDSLVAFLDEAGLNLLAGDVDPQIVADSLHHRWDERSAVRHAWSETVNRLQPTSVAWIPAFASNDEWPFGLADSSRGARGGAPSAACVLDSALWDERVVPAAVTLARLAGDQRELVPALAVDLDQGPVTERRGPAIGREFCDAAWRQAISRMGRRAELDSIPIAARYRTLCDGGLLAAYYDALQTLVAERARGIRDRVLRLRPGLYFAFRFHEAPGDWFSLGLLRGFSLPDRPVLLFTPEVRTRGLLAAYRARGLDAVHAVELPPALVRVRNLPALRRAVFGENDGFWLPVAGRGTSDSLAQALRRLTR